MQPINITSKMLDFVYLLSLITIKFKNKHQNFLWKNLCYCLAVIYFKSSKVAFRLYFNSNLSYSFQLIVYLIDRHFSKMKIKDSMKIFVMLCHL